MCVCVCIYIYIYIQDKTMGLTCSFIASSYNTRLSWALVLAKANLIVQDQNRGLGWGGGGGGAAGERTGFSLHLVKVSDTSEAQGRNDRASFET